MGPVIWRRRLLAVDMNSYPFSTLPTTVSESCKVRVKIRWLQRRANASTSGLKFSKGAKGWRKVLVRGLGVMRGEGWGSETRSMVFGGNGAGSSLAWLLLGVLRWLLRAESQEEEERDYLERELEPFLSSSTSRSLRCLRVRLAELVGWANESEECAEGLSRQPMG
ncbi:hypothetical protein KC19_VG013800 [Ceratodon purpureus]|uniref:Uncharacterized protein n=1 Tax=Ceratodon purpureus TaxID=3225 RepID=A0A8T0HKY9_CERPU|nr:hypothetical protein KC19_VG013800 [Ceratodon purpureus]